MADLTAKELDPRGFVVKIDNREQLPFGLEVRHDDQMVPLHTVRGTLATGDYSVVHLEHLVACERKSLEDLVSVVGVGRERFEREIQRLLGYPSRIIIVEANFTELELGNWRSKVTPTAVIGSVLGWMERGIPILFAGSRRAADVMCARWLYTAARRRRRELKAYEEHLKRETEKRNESGDATRPVGEGPRDQEDSER